MQTTISSSSLNILKKEIYNKVIRYYTYQSRNKETFIPGKTRINYAGRIYDEKELVSLIDSALEFWLTAGRFAKQFENDLANFLGMKYCILTNSGSSANLLAVSALTSPELGEKRLKPGDEIITVAASFPTTINPIIQNNLIPVFIDVNLGTYNIKAEKIEEAIDSKILDPKNSNNPNPIKAIFMAHTMGNPFNINMVTKIAKKYDLWLIEDTCDSLGSKYKLCSDNNEYRYNEYDCKHDEDYQYTGTFGHISTFSFYPAHHITMGEGGAIVTNDPKLKKIVESLRDWGRDCWCEPGHDNNCKKRFEWKHGKLPYGYDHKYIYSHMGYNLKITDMQAAIGVEQLKKLPVFIEKRKNNFNLLYQGLKKYEKYFILPIAEDNSDPSWFGFMLTIRPDIDIFTRKEIINYLEENKIVTRMLFAGNITKQPYFKDVNYKIFGNLTNTDIIVNNTFWIGVYPGITEEMIKYILKVFDNFFNFLNDNN